MSKPTHDELINETADYLSAYIGAGVSVDPVIQNLDPNTNIRGLTELLEYHFLLTGNELNSTQEPDRTDTAVSGADTGGIVDRNQTPVGVLDFVSLLDRRLRSIDPAIRQEMQVHRGEIRGKIDWHQTIKHRRSVGDTQGQTFACKTQKRTAQTTKNRVLLDLLGTIRGILDRFDNKFDIQSANVDWFSPWYPDGNMRRTLSDAIDNVYLSELDLEDLSVSKREIREVLSDRSSLYREAGTLLQTYRRIQDGAITERQAKDLFRTELFAPSEENGGTADLFELYWIFKLLDQFDRPRFQQISSKRSQLVALWKTDEYEYMLFNDWRGHYRWNDEREYRDYIQIELDVTDVDPEAWTDSDTHEFVRRTQSVIRNKNAIKQTVFNYDEGRKSPDIILLELNRTTSPPTLEHIFIGEVKHSTSRGTIEHGIQQLYEYAAHVKIGPHLQLHRDDDNPYISAEPDFLNAPELELGYFVGDAALIKGTYPESMQICGYGDELERPFI